MNGGRNRNVLHSFFLSLSFFLSSSSLYFLLLLLLQFHYFVHVLRGLIAEKRAVLDNAKRVLPGAQQRRVPISLLLVLVLDCPLRRQQRKKRERETEQS